MMDEFYRHGVGWEHETSLTGVDSSKCYCQIKQRWCHNANLGGYCMITACTELAGLDTTRTYLKECPFWEDLLKLSDE